MTRDEQIRHELVSRHDRILGLLMFSNSERRRIGVNQSNAQLRRELKAIGLAITQHGA